MMVYVYDQDFIDKWHRYERMYQYAPGQVSDLMEDSFKMLGVLPDSVKVEADCVIVNI